MPAMRTEMAQMVPSSQTSPGHCSWTSVEDVWGLDFLLHLQTLLHPAQNYLFFAVYISALPTQGIVRKKMRQYRGVPEEDTSLQIHSYLLFRSSFHLSVNSEVPIIHRLLVALYPFQHKDSDTIHVSFLGWHWHHIRPSKGGFGNTWQKGHLGKDTLTFLIFFNYLSLKTSGYAYSKY